jgi:hypothetical protein
MPLSTKRSQYDLAVAYRIYPQMPQHALGLPFSDDKFLLAETCLNSFKKSLGDLSVKLWVLLDGCPEEFKDMFARYFEARDLVFISLPQAGNEATFARQIDTLLDQDESDVVYFAEDDYFYLPGQFRCMINFLLANDGVDFVSPYDHLDCYTMDLHREPKWLKMYGGRHWRTASSTCLTFLTKKKTLQKTQAVFRSYKRRSLDCSIWLSLTKRRLFNPFFVARKLIEDRFTCKIILKSWLYCWRQILFGRIWKLWVPIPAVATHLDVNALSPNVEWQRLIELAGSEKLKEVSIAKCT